MTTKLTLITGRAFPSLFADAGEGISSPHTGPTIGTRTGGACAVLGCGRREDETRIARLDHNAFNEKRLYLAVLLSA